MLWLGYAEAQHNHSGKRAFVCKMHVLRRTHPAIPTPWLAHHRIMVRLRAAADVFIVDECLCFAVFWRISYFSA